MARRVPFGVRGGLCFAFPVVEYSSAVTIGTMSYHGPATIVSNGNEIPAVVTLRVDTSQPLRSWDGSGTIEVSGIPNISLDMSTIRLPDGREAQAHVSVHFNSANARTRIEITGSGEPPFDFLDLSG